MERSAGMRLAQAARRSVTRLLASSAAASALGSVVITNRAAVTTLRVSALLEARQRAGDGRGTAEAFHRQPAHHLAAAQRHHAEPPAHGQFQQAAVQLDVDLRLRVVGEDVLQEEYDQAAHL